MKTLLVSYTPRNERSKSKPLLEAFRAGICNSEIEELDLCRSTPDLFTPERVEAYYARNIQRRALSGQEEESLAGMLRMTAQLKAADVVALCFPMYNFSLPAIVKAWFDSVLHVGETIDPTGGKYQGMMSGKRALIMATSGGIYSVGNGVGPHFGPQWEHAVSLAKCEFEFMGYSEIRAVLAEGMAIGDPNKASENMEGARLELHTIANAWYCR
jgi:FMN-dependent NADH-azoreductase